MASLNVPALPSMASMFEITAYLEQTEQMVADQKTVDKPSPVAKIR
jgi:hypothetical protein